MSIKLLLVKEGARIKWSNNATGKKVEEGGKKGDYAPDILLLDGVCLAFQVKDCSVAVSNLMAKQSTRLYKNKQTQAFPEPHKEKALYEMSLTSEIF